MSGELIRLETGDWIDPALVAHVEGTVRPHGWCVIVTLTDHTAVHVLCNGRDEAGTKADAIAARINAARLGGGANGEGGGATARLPIPRANGPLSVACPYCKAEPGQGCEGGQPGHYHLDRYTEAERSGA